MGLTEKHSADLLSMLFKKYDFACCVSLNLRNRSLDVYHSYHEQSSALRRQLDAGLAARQAWQLNTVISMENPLKSSLLHCLLTNQMLQTWGIDRILWECVFSIHDGESSVFFEWSGVVTQFIQQHA